MITVFHNSKFLVSYLGLIYTPEIMPIVDFRHLSQVAVVNTDSLDEAFIAVQNGPHNWTDNHNVQVIQKSRSTAVGDVLQTKDGNYWLVALDDFLLLGKRLKSKISDGDIFEFNHNEDSYPSWMQLLNT